MIRKRRRNFVFGSNVDKISEPHQISTPVKCSKRVTNPGKENIPPSSINDECSLGVTEAIHQTDGGCYSPVQSQAKLQPLSQFDESISVIGDSNLDSEWTGTFMNSSLDDLDSEILESSSLVELDSEILGDSYVTDSDSDELENSVGSEPVSQKLGSPVCGSSSPCEFKKLKCGSNGVGSYQSRSIECRLLSTSFAGNGEFVGKNSSNIDVEDADVNVDEEGFESTQFDALMELCAAEDDFNCHEPGPVLICPMCRTDISELDEESRQFHANECLDKSCASKEIPSTDVREQSPQSSHRPAAQSSAQTALLDPVSKWLQSLGLAKYEAAFIQHEIDWDSLQCLTEEDLATMGITALGPRKKIMQSIKELRKRDNTLEEEANGASEHNTDTTKNTAMNKLITDFFPGSSSGKKKTLVISGQQPKGKANTGSRQRQATQRNTINGKSKDVPPWCSVPGTPFRVDAFRYLRRDCSHWFLTHFHIDHYQGLTKSFSYGKIFCSMVTAKLINAKIGISWDKLKVIPLNQKINIGGVDVTFYDANHCPGSIIILFEPHNGEAVLHTGDFRLNEEMAASLRLQSSRIHTLILDTTYCNPQYDFPKQEVVMQFVIEAIQAESFNPKTLFLIGSYTIGKERLFLEVARVLQKKIYVPVAKLRLLECLELPAEDMQWFTLNEHETNIHVVPMWTIASFKRLKQLSNQYTGRCSLIVAFSPTGWTLGKGKTAGGRRRQQGTIIRYEVPYSEHCSFEELKKFVKLLSPVKILPSVNNDGEASSNAMIELLLS